LRGHGLNIDEAPTQGPMHATQLAREAVAAGADLIFSAGGDGTLNEVLNGMAGSDAVLGMLPGGTANVLAMEAGLSGRMTEAARRFPELAPRPVAVGCLERETAPRYFLLMAGAGLDAHIVEHLRPGMKKALGKVAYWIGGFASALRLLPEFDACIDGRNYRTSFALISRVRNYGGDLEIARQVRLTDPDFEIVLFEGRHALRYLTYFTGVLTHTHRHLPGVTILRAREIEIAASAQGPAWIQIDGESAGLLPARVRIAPQPVRLLLPAAYGRR
jgi:diacylglycerol kinase family enzyme